MDASLAFAVELEQRDETAAARLATLAALDRSVDDIRAQAERVSVFNERLPADRSHLEQALVDAETDLSSARDALVGANEAVARARSDDARTTARRHEAHAASDLHTSEERRNRLAGRQESLEREAVEADSESASLFAEALALSGALETAPRVARPAPPGPHLEEILEWTARAHAALFVARSGLETERERVVREANELAASVLGEPLYATSVAVVRKRIQERLS